VVPSDGERLATIEQVARDIRDDVHELRVEQKDDHHRLRAVTASVELLVHAQKQTKDQRDYELRKLAVKVQWLTLGVAMASFALGFVVAILAH
jgi:hypothetical protein